MQTLDSLGTKTGTAPFIVKIDVEGTEARVLKGAACVIRESRPVVLFESFDHREECQELLRFSGYECFDSERFSHVGPQTTNFVCFQRSTMAAAVLDSLKGLGYPIR